MTSCFILLFRDTRVYVWVDALAAVSSVDGCLLVVSMPVVVEKVEEWTSAK